jgi:hypothetical protein
VHAELDTNAYPTGIQVSDDEIAALPITRHRSHGDWNYTLHPQHPLDATAINSTSDQARANSPHRLTQHSLQDPELTGMTRQQLSKLIDEPTPALEIQRERVLRTRRCHERLVAPGTGAKAKLTPAERILATVLHLRKLATMDPLGQLFGVTAMTISRAKQEVRPLLEAHGHHVNTSTARLRTPADVATFLASDRTPSKVNLNAAAPPSRQTLPHRRTVRSVTRRSAAITVASSPRANRSAASSPAVPASPARRAYTRPSARTS